MPISARKNLFIKNLSVFFPLYNEEGNVEAAVEKAKKILERLNLEYEILLINDGSTDKTAEISDNLAKDDPKIRVIHHQQNLGYGEALKSGFYNAQYDTIVYTDGDGQFDFAEVSKFLEKIADYDLVIGYRIKRQDPFFRILFKQGWQLLLLLFFGLTLKDVDCGFKMISKKVLEKIPHLESTRGAMINAELAIKAKKYGFRVGQVGVNHYPRLSGKPTGANLRVIIKSFIDLFKLWWKLKDQKVFFVLLMGVLLLAAFFRFYKLSEYMTFLGDEGRDAIVIKDMLVNHHFPLIGPPTSVGNIYLGPLYYYMMAFSMAIFWLNPVAAAGMNAVIGVTTIVFIYYLGKIWFGRLAGLIAAFLYAICPVTIIYSKSSWNPNPAPFFALLGIFGLYKMHKSGNFLWLTLTGAAFAAAAQMHYLALILVPFAVVLYFHEIWYRAYKSEDNKNLVEGTILGIFAYLLVMSPIFWFDLRHDFLNYRALVKLFSQSGTVGNNLGQSLSRVPTLFSQNLIGRYMSAEWGVLTFILSVLFVGIFIYFVWKKVKTKTVSWPILTIFVWLLIGLLGLSFYRGDIYDHYLGFLNPAPFLLLGSVVIYLPNILSKKWLVNGGLIVLVVALTVVNLQRNPLLFPPNNQLKRTQDVAKFIINEANGQPFNFALLAKNNYDAAYQFYLDLYGHNPKKVPFEITEQLFVVCEDKVCEPINNPKYEIAGWGWAKIAFLKEFAGVRVFKLVHNPSGKP